MPLQRIQTFFLLLFAGLLLAGCPADDGVDLADAGPVAADAGDGGDDGDDVPAPRRDAGGIHQQPGSGSGHDGGAVGETDDPDPSSDPGGGANASGRFFLPTPEADNTRAPDLILDARGDLHAIYPAYAGGGAYYAFCADNCAVPDAMQVVALPTDGTVLNAMLALTSTGKPRVLLATALNLVWAQCDDACTAVENWHSSIIVEHGGDRDVSGNALALDAQDRPRFVMHTYVALLGIGQKPPATYYAQCDGACGDASNWRIDMIQEQIWQSSQLRFDTSGRAHLGTVAVEFTSGVPSGKQAAYLVCEDGDCTSAESWSGIVLAPAYESTTAEIAPAIALALTAEGGPRLVLLGKGESDAKQLLYFQCDDGCADNNWSAALISENAALGAGVDIELDAAARPRLAFTLDANIGLYHCDSADCTADDSKWDLTKVEFASDVPRDNIILWPNCNVDAWFLHDPSLALGPDGSVRVGYQASDVSGGGVLMPDPTKPQCLAGKDMTLARLALLPSYR